MPGSNIKTKDRPRPAEEFLAQTYLPETPKKPNGLLP